MVGLRTLRAKLTVTAVLVMGALLATLGGVVYVAAHEALLGSVDRELRSRADTMASEHIRRQHEAPPLRPFPLRAPPSDPLRTLRPRVFPVQSKYLPPEPPQTPFDGMAFGEAKAGHSVLQTIHVEGEPVRILTRPLYENGKVAAVLQIPYAIGDINRSLASLSGVLLTLIPFGLVFTALASRWLVDRLLKPIRHITRDTEAIGAGNLAERIHVEGEDEFAALATTLNKMLERLETAFASEQATSRKLEATVKQQRRFTADASHELKTPLAVIKANAGLAKLQSDLEPDTRESLEEIEGAANRMNGLVQGLLALARADGGGLAQRFAPCSVNELLRKAAAQSRKGAGVTIFEASEDVSVMASPDDLIRVFVNLIDNAILHAQPSRIEIRIANDGTVEVEDDGIGIASAHLPHLFERFYRADAARSAETGGTGLGLAICKGIVEAHGGTIDVSSQLGIGTCFRVQLPVEVPAKTSP